MLYKKTLLIAAIAFVSVSCAPAAHLTVNVDNTYTLTKRSHTALGKGDDLMYDLYVESKSYCEKQGKQMTSIEEISSDGILYVDFAHAQLKFTCQ